MYEVDNEIEKGHDKNVEIVAGSEISVDLQILNGHKDNVTDSVSNLDIKGTIHPGPKTNITLSRHKSKKYK